LVNGSYSTNGIDCTLEDTIITVSNLRYSGILGTQKTSSGGGTSISKDTHDTTEDLKDVLDSNASKESIENISSVVVPEEEEPKDNIVSSDKPNYNPDAKETPIDYSRKNKTATIIWIITFLFCAIIICGTIYLLTKIRYR
jgi:hypothetical protein